MDKEPNWKKKLNLPLNKIMEKVSPLFQISKELSLKDVFLGQENTKNKELFISKSWAKKNKQVIGSKKFKNVKIFYHTSVNVIAQNKKELHQFPDSFSLFFNFLLYSN